MKSALLFIGLGVAGVILLFVVLKSKAQNLLSVGNISSINGDFSSDFTNLGRIVQRLGGSSTPSSGTSSGGSTGSLGGTASSLTHTSCYTNANGQQKCAELPSNCVYSQPNGRTSLYKVCTSADGRKTTTRIY